MKKLITILKSITYVLLIFFVKNSFAQDTTAINKTEYVAAKIYRVLKNDGSEYIGEIIEDNGRELLLNSKSIGKIYIPKHEIKSITLAKRNESSSIQHERTNASKYFFTSSAIPLKKKENVLTLYGGAADLKFALSDNISFSTTTSWGLTPIIASLKITHSISDNLHIAVGVTGGGIFLFYDEGIYGVAPFGILTIGNQHTNISLTGASLTFNDLYGSTKTIGVYSAAIKLGFTNKLSFVADSFLLFDDNNFDRDNVGAFVIVGLRVTTKKGAFQVGLGQFYADGERIVIPLPIIGWITSF